VIRRVDEGDKGKGLTRESDIKGVDGLLTNQKGVTLVTFFADCTPVMLYEPGIKAIASIHSGWRGTLKNIAAEAAGAMAKLPGFDPGRLIAAIGPSIRNCCFEVGDDVYSLFKEKYPDEDLYGRGTDGKWHVDLQAIIRNAVIQCGLREENIHDSGICTKCRKDLFFSYRGDCGKTGSHAAFMCLK
jgi:YfiH family protein